MRKITVILLFLFLFTHIPILTLLFDDSPERLRGVIFDGKRFIAAGTNALIFDPISGVIFNYWAGFSISPDVFGFVGICYNSGEYAGVGYNSNPVYFQQPLGGFCMVSSNGTTWNAVILASSGPQMSLITYGRGYYAMGTISGHLIYTSSITDYKSWRMANISGSPLITEIIFIPAGENMGI